MTATTTTTALLPKFPSLTLPHRLAVVSQNAFRLLANILPVADIITVKTHPLARRQEAQGRRAIVLKHGFPGAAARGCLWWLRCAVELIFVQAGG